MPESGRFFGRLALSQSDEPFAAHKQLLERALAQVSHAEDMYGRVEHL